MKTQSPAVEQISKLESSLKRVIRSQSDAVTMALVAILADGHILIEDVPGVGKTTLAHAIARVTDCAGQRIQFTSDMLPSDVVGINIFNQALERFEFKRGPIFANIVLADEINRTTPKTQSALLEAMNEHQVTVDNETYELPRPFMVIATQNPVEHHGTYPLPESQLDRFLLRIRMGYPRTEDERDILRGQAGAEVLDQLTPVLSADDILELQQMTREVQMDESLIDYELALVQATRRHEALSLGVSPRGALMLHRAAQAHALIEGRSYCVPNDLKRMVVPVFAHRVIVNTRFAHTQRKSEHADAIIAELRNSIPVPE